MISFDSLRPPSLVEPSAGKYKDWLHLNILDHESGSVGLINCSLHGSPADTRSRAIGTAIVHIPGVGWVGNIQIGAFSEAAIGRSSINLKQMALSVHQPSGILAASVSDPENS